MASSYLKLVVKIARELHKPIYEVLDFPSSEIELWYAVFLEEYYELNPDKKLADDIKYNNEHGMSVTESKLAVERMKSQLRRVKK